MIWWKGTTKNSQFLKFKILYFTHYLIKLTIFFEFLGYKREPPVVTAKQPLRVVFSIVCQPMTMQLLPSPMDPGLFTFHQLLVYIFSKLFLYFFSVEGLMPIRISMDRFDLVARQVPWPRSKISQIIFEKIVEKVCVYISLNVCLHFWQQFVCLFLQKKWKIRQHQQLLQWLQEIVWICLLQQQRENPCLIWIIAKPVSIQAPDLYRKTVRKLLEEPQHPL